MAIQSQWLYWTINSNISINFAKSTLVFNFITFCFKGQIPVRKNHQMNEEGSIDYQCFE